MQDWKKSKLVTSTLFSPFTLRSMTLSNRIMVSPMAQYSAADGCATDWHLMHLGTLAVSGAGALVIEATSVNPNGRNAAVDLGLWNDKQAASFRPALAFCRQHSDVKVGLQLLHVGRKGSVAPSWEGHRPLSVEQGGWRVYGASDIQYPGRNPPIAMSRQQIAEVIEDFADAARRGNALGFDFIELHGAHGYLIHNFLSPLTNRRDDEYGGSLENRMRFALEVFTAVRRVWPEDKPVGMRISATDWVSGGWSVDDSVALAKALRALGCDYITASSGGAVPEQQLEVYPGYQVPFAERIRNEARLPTIAVGLITEARQAEEILTSGKADLVALGRSMLYNPRWPWHAAIELGDEPAFPPQYARAHPAMRGGDFLKSRRDA